MSIYLITARELGRAKIGYSLNPIKRLSALSTASPAKLRLEAVIPACPKNEIELHQGFFLQRSHLEWFNLNYEIERLMHIFGLIATKPTVDKGANGCERTIDSVRKAISLPGITKRSIAKASGIHVNTLLGCEKDSWNPTAATLRAIEPHLPKAEDAA